MEIVLRALVLYFFLWIVVRAVGRATLGELSSFQLLLYVTMGDLIQQGVTQQDYSVTAAVLAVSTFAVLTVGVSYFDWRWPRSRPVIDGVPVVILKDGRPLTSSLDLERLTAEDLAEAARQQGFEQLSDIELAVLENNGRISFFGRGESGRNGAGEGPVAA